MHGGLTHTQHIIQACTLRALTLHMMHVHVYMMLYMFHMDVKIILSRYGSDIFLDYQHNSLLV